MAIFPFSVDSVRIGTANITASGGNIVLPAGTQVGNQPVATVVEVSTGGGPKITNLQITDNAWTVLDDTAVDTAGGYVLITGTNFVSGALVYFNQTAANSVAFVGTTTLRVTVPALTAGTYIVYVINPDGGTAIRVPGLTASANPAWQTASALPEQYDGVAITLNLVATDATSYTVTSGSLPPGLSLNANTGVITGTVTGVAVDTVYTFTVRATDAQLQDSPRTFTVTITVSDPYFKLTTLLLSGSAISANTVIRDSSTNNFNLTVFGDARASNFTPYGTGWSNYFDGSGDWLVTSNVGTTTGDFTLELWCYLDSSQPQGWYPYVFGTNSPWQGSGGIGLAYNTQSGVADGTPLYFNVASGGITVDTHSNLKSRWVHLALTRSGSTIRAFLNGTVLASTLTNSSTINTSTFMIGGVDEGGSYGNHAMKCWISNFRFVKDSALYTANFTPATSSLTSITNTALLICQSNRFVDNSANNYSLSRSGDVKIDSFNPFNITNTGVNGSMYFDGTGDYCTTSGNAAFALGTGDFCLETWIYPNSISTGTFDRIVATSDYNGAGFDWTLNTASSALYVAGTAYSISNLVVKSWNHLVYTRSGGVLRGFLNGNLAVYNASATGNVTSTGELRIGTGYSGTAYNGYISNLRIVKSSVPAAYQTSSTTINTTVFSPPTTLLTAVTGTSLLTLQYDQPHNNHTFLDSSSNQFLITRNGNATQGTFSPFSPNGWSNYFVANNANTVTAATAAGVAFGTGDFCQEFFLYATSYTGTWRIISYASVSGTASLLISSGAVLGADTGVGGLNTGITLPVNTWFHLAYTRQSGRVRIFVNGVLQYNFADTTNYSTSQSVYIGGYPGYTQSWDGYISNARIIKGSVPAAYQTSSTTNGTSVFTPPTGPLTAVTGTELLTCQSSRFVDNNTQTTAKTITLTSSPQVQAFSPFAPTAAYNPMTHGGSAYFDRTGDFLSLATNNSFDFGTGNFTVELFYYPLAYDDIQMFFSGTSNYQFGYSASDSRNLYYYGSSGGNVISGTPASSMLLNQWNHIVLVRSGTSLAIMSNGVRQGTATHSSSVNFSGSPIVGGYADSTASYAIRGYMAGFRAVKGVAIYDPTQTTYTVPAAPVAATTNTSLLLNFTDAAILDSTGRTVIETVADAKSSGVVTKFTGGSMYFDGTGDYLVVPSSVLHLFGTQAFTVEAWVYTTTTKQYQHIYGTHNADTNWIVRLLDNKIMMYTGSADITGVTVLATNTWYHVAAVREGTGTNQTKLYVNGTLDVTGTNATNYTTQSQAWIGAQINSPSITYFQGYIADLRITRGYARYTANFTAPTAPARLK
jgi:hypothetical protein